MKIAERIVLTLLFIALLGGAAWIYFTVQYEHQQVVDAVARGEYEIREPVATTTPDEDWRVYYPDTVPVTIGNVSVLASVADSLPERIQGLSGTPYLPENVVKIFAFGAAGSHAIWMKDMQYGIDILWAAQDGAIVHIEENVLPDTYPQSFGSPTPAWYVVEAEAGFVAKHAIKLGDLVTVIAKE